MPYSQSVEVFDIVPYKRKNWALNRMENCIAIWMRSSTPIEGVDTDSRVLVHFAPLGKSVFVRTVQEEGIGYATELAYIAKEVKPADVAREIKGRPPVGYDHCPERVAVTRPTIGGRFKSEVLASKRQAKIDARMRR